MRTIKPEHWMHALDQMESGLLGRISDEDMALPPSSEEPGDAENTGMLDEGDDSADSGGILIVVGGKPVMEPDADLAKRRKR